MLGFRTGWHAEAAALVPNSEVVLEPTYVTEVLPAGHAVRVAFPHLKYLDGTRHGYAIVDLTPTLMTASWYYSPNTRIHSDAEVAGTTLVCERGSAHLQPA